MDSMKGLLKMKNRKVCSLLLVALLVIITPIQSNAKSVSDYSVKTVTLEELESSSTSPEYVLEQKNVQTKAVKKAIRWALKHSDDLAEAAGRYFGKDVGRSVARNFAKAAPVLNQLLKYDTLVWRTVQDQLTHVVGSKAAVWITYALQFAL